MQPSSDTHSSSQARPGDDSAVRAYKDDQGVDLADREFVRAAVSSWREIWICRIVRLFGVANQENVWHR